MQYHTVDIAGILLLLPRSLAVALENNACPLPRPHLDTQLIFFDASIVIGGLVRIIGSDSGLADRPGRSENLTD
jgi:hypothetical protein